MDEVNGRGAKGITRRDFIETTAVVAAGVALGPTLAAESGERRRRVVLVRDELALDAAGKPRPEVIQSMMDRGICTLFDVKQPVEGWKRVVGQANLVGVKTNTWKYLPTPPEVEDAIKRRLVEAGVPEARVVVDDRGARETLAPCPILVNARPVRTHHWAGIGGCLKNPIMFAEEPSFYHPDLCADLGALWKLPTLKDKVKLNVLVALTPQFLTRSANHFDARYVWPYKGIFFSTDPVAIDTLGVTLLDAKRRLELKEERPLTQLAHHVRIAGEKHGLGVWDLAKIDFIKVGWDKDRLI